VIIGAGVAGLVAAKHCEEAGHKPIVLEASDRPGGRVKTDHLQGFRLDHGFQVMLTGYEETRRYLDFDALDLRAFRNGARIFDGSRSYRVSDPLRDFSQLLPMVFSPVGTLRDKYLVWRLTRELKAQQKGAQFTGKRERTLDYLRNYGFSARMINNFFQPFFGGIFLENELRTPCQMFRFVFKLFSESSAVVPAMGIEAIVEQLRARLQHTEFRYGRQVEAVQGQEIRLADGKVIPYHKLIIATEPSQILPNLAGQPPSYVNTCNLYFRCDRSLLQEPIIALVNRQESLINNFCMLTDLSRAYAPDPDQHLLSVTLKHIPRQESIEVAHRVTNEIRHLTGQEDAQLDFLARYDIPRALPEVPAMQYDLPATQFRLSEDIYLAGDYLLNASLDAAMRSGRRAAEAMLDSLR